MAAIHKRLYAVMAVLACICCALPLFAEYNRKGMPDSALIRRDVEETWLYPPASVLREKQPEVLQNEAGELFEVRFEETEDRFFVIIAPRRAVTLSVYSQDGMSTMTSDVYAAEAYGSWILTKNSADNSFVSIKYYIAPDTNVFVQLREEGGTALADFVVYGSFAARGVQLGVPIEQLYTASFADIAAWTRTTLPWQYIDILPELYHSPQQMVSVIRENLGRIVYTEDAVLEGDGTLVHLSSGAPFEAPDDMHDAENKLFLSSGGFVKWIVDGLLLPETGGALKIEPLLRQTTARSPISRSGVLEQTYNLDFALDWTRNLAAGAESVYTGSNMLYADSGVDVQIDPFASELSPAGIAVSSGYIRNAGYPIQTLQALFYVLAVQEPGKFYLGALRETDMSQSPEIHFFTNCIAFFPYFDANAEFKIAVFMNGQETTLDRLEEAYPDTFVHLVRISASDMFFPE